MTLNYCPVCGKYILGDSKHRCSEKRLQRIERELESEEMKLEDENSDPSDFTERFQDGTDDISKYGR